MLRLIWLTSLALAAASIAIMVLLVLARILNDWRSRREAKLYGVLTDRLLAWVEDPRQEDDIARLLVRHCKAATSVVTQIFELVRGEDQQLLAKLAERCGIQKTLQHLLARGSAQDRLRAAESLAWFRSPETRIALVAALDDKTDDVALAAAASLASMGEKLAIARLLRRPIVFSQKSSHRLQAVLARVAPYETGDLIRVAADSFYPEGARAAAIEAIARAGVFDFIDSISVFAEDRSSVVRAAVARGLGVFAHPRGAEAIAKLLDDLDWEVRAEAAESAGRIGLTTFLNPLSLGLSDENWWVRFRAGEALAMLGSAGLDALRRLASSTNDAPSSMARIVLAERGLA